MCVSICVLRFLLTLLHILCMLYRKQDSLPVLFWMGHGGVQHLVSYAFPWIKCKSDVDEERDEEELGIRWVKRCWVFVKHSSESLALIWRSSWVSLLKENTWLAWWLSIRCEPELLVARRCWWWTFHSSLPVSSEEAVCGTQEHKEGRDGEVLVWSSLTLLKCIWRCVKK